MNLGSEKWPLNYTYPEELVALKPKEPCRVFCANHENISHENISHENISHENINHENIGHENIGHENINHENISHENISHENISHENINHENINHENISHENINHENISHENKKCEEIQWTEVGRVFSPGDVLVINTSGVKACRIFSKNQKREILFLEERSEEKLEEKLEERSEEKLEEKLEERSEEKLEEKLEERSEEKLEERSEEKLEERLEEERLETRENSAEEKENNIWRVLFNSRDLKVGEFFEIPGGITAKLIERGRPQTIKLSKKIDLQYFNEFGQMALPPYIQKARGQRNALEEDFYWYQLDWKKNQNSLAAPTASLHFKKEDIESFSKDYGVHIAEVSLDVGLGTFLPLEQKNFDEGRLHKETFSVPVATKEKIFAAKKNKKRVWALGTTALRAVESMSDTLNEDQSQTELFIYPGYEFKYISGLLTNFHQPNSSLLLLVMAFFGVEETLKAYNFIVEKKFRLFSYGDLSIWTKPLP